MCGSLPGQKEIGQSPLADDMLAGALRFGHQILGEKSERLDAQHCTSVERESRYFHSKHASQSLDPKPMLNISHLNGGGHRIFSNPQCPAI